MSAKDRDQRKVWMVVLAFVGILCTLPLVTRMLAEAWHNQQLVYHLAFAVASLPVLNISLVVLIPAGAILGLIVVFAFDEYKRVQRYVLLASVPLFAITLYFFGLWTPETVNWQENWWGLPLGVLVGGMLGIVGGTLSRGGRGRRTFPTASRLLYGVVVGTVVVGLFERSLDYTSLIVARGSRVVIQSSGVPLLRMDPWLVIYFVASVILIVVVATFVNYSNRHSVLVVTPLDGEVYALSLLKGLYTAASENPHYEEVVPTEGQTLLTEAQIFDDLNDIEDEIIQEISSGVGFQFVQQSALSRRRYVEYSGLDLPWDDEVEEIESLSKSRSNTDVAARVLSSAISNAVPTWARDITESRSNRRVERIDAVETVIFLVPLSSIVVIDDSSDEKSIEYRRPTSLKKFKRLYDAYLEDPTRDRFFVATEGEAAMTAFEHENGYRTLYDVELDEFVAEDILDVPYVTDDLFTVTHGDDEGGGRQGFQRVLDRI